MGFGEPREMDNLVRQEETEFVIAHGRWKFEWCTQDKQIFSWGIDTYLYSGSMKPLYIYIYVCVVRHTDFFLLREFESLVTKLLYSGE